MQKPDRSLKAILITIALLLGVIAVRPFIETDSTVMAQSARFDHVYIIAPMFLYKGHQGMLVMDRRNANVWFIPKVNEQYKAPVFVLKVPLDLLDQAPQ
jgi:hypothetical protein